MKRQFTKYCAFLYCFAALLNACTSTKKAAGKKSILIITNPSAIERTDELVTLTREFIEKKKGL